MSSTDPFPEKDWKIDRMFFQGQIRTVAICKKEISFGNTNIKCNYICRKDRPNDANHLCTFNRITKYFNNKYSASPIELMFFTFMVRANISYSAAVSNEMFSFIHSLIIIGQNSVIEKLPNKLNVVPSPQVLFPFISRQTLAKNFDKAADSIRRHQLENLKKV